MQSSFPHGVALGAACGLFFPAAGRRAALILQTPFYEGMVARRGMSALARRLAAAGLPTLLLDPAGDGDGGAGETTPDSMTADAARALDALLAAGAERVTLIGFRFGALIAARLAGRRAEVDELALLAPPPGGAEMLREWRALRAIMRKPGRDEGEAFAIAGHVVPPAFLAQAAGLRLDDLDPRGVSRILLAAGPAMRGPEALTALWAGAGASVSAQGFVDYDAFMCDVTASHLPAATLDAAARWAAAAARPGPPLALAARALEGPGWRESVWRGADAEFCGVLTLPPRPRRALALLNAGRAPHQGWARQHVALARRLAAEGVATLRLDLPGTGDSPAEAGDLYDPGLAARLSHVFDDLEARGLGPIAVAGLCSGAFHAFHAAMADTRVDAVFLVNLLTFAPRPTQRAGLAAWGAAKRRSAGGERAAAGSAADDLEAAMPLARGLAKQTLAAFDSLLARAGTLAGRSAGTRAAATAFLARGGALTLAHAAGDASVEEAERELGPLLSAQGVTRLITPDCDHEFSPPAAREALAGLIAATLAARRSAAA